MKYKYAGPDAGIAGLPHEVTTEEAAELGVSKILEDAIKNGSYVAVETTQAPPPTPPQMGTSGEGSKKDKKPKHESEDE